ncbi:sensor histidine kinase [Psychrobacillus psychrodurans]|uniref:sensor histidine kinase n=1 Tax=Psychrobacillus psychrodurans TaxID=126157 RepID=UPI001F4EF7F9|nr:sensor histidine kinase [Psychrobacillus psychrodurans]MCK1999235.1 sensor histidine kinase [Psychrobacillus psychrodurans]
MTNNAHSELVDSLIGMYENSSEAFFFFNKDNKLLHLNPIAKEIVDTDAIDAMLEGQERSICQTCKGYTNTTELISCENCYFFDPKQDFSSFQVYLDTKDIGVLPYVASFHTIDSEKGTKVLILRNLTKLLETRELLFKNTTIKQIIKAQEDERKRISRELHDSVAQEILSSLVDLRLMKYLKSPEEVSQKVQHMEASLTRLLDEIRNMSVELRPSSLDDLGIEAALRSHFKWIEKNYGLVVHYTSEIKGKRFLNEIETVVYRICQESILNALKYADVDEVNVELYEKDDNLILKIVDDGIGFDTSQRVFKGTGLGLFGMKERAELVGGKLSIMSSMGKGTEVLLYIPLKER